MLRAVVTLWRALLHTRRLRHGIITFALRVLAVARGVTHGVLLSDAKAARRLARSVVRSAVGVAVLGA